MYQRHRDRTVRTDVDVAPRCFNGHDSAAFRGTDDCGQHDHPSADDHDDRSLNHDDRSLNHDDHDNPR
jgi:hypothetical protein